MPQYYYLVTDSDEIFYYGLLEDGQQLSTGLPTTLTYNNESDLAQGLGTVTGNPLYYYENQEEDPANPTTGGPGVSTLVTTNDPYEIAAGSFLQTWKVSGTDLDYLENSTVEIQEGNFVLTGIFSILESYAFNQTETIFQLVSPNSFLPYEYYGLNGMPGKLIISPSSGVGSDYNYYYFSGLSKQEFTDPTFQYFRMQGNLDGFDGENVILRWVGSEISGVALQVIEPYDSGSNITLCKVDSAFQISDVPVYMIITIDPNQPLPPTVGQFTGKGRTSFQDPDASIQYFDIYEDFTQFSPGGSINVTKQDGSSVSGSISEVYFWGEELTPVTRIYIEGVTGPAPFEDSGTSISWRAD
jgi:hypothetical protein